MAYDTKLKRTLFHSLVRYTHHNGGLAIITRPDGLENPAAGVLVELVVEESGCEFQFVILDDIVYMVERKRFIFGDNQFDVYTVSQPIQDKILRLLNG